MSYLEVFLRQYFYLSINTFMGQCIYLISYSGITGATTRQYHAGTTSTSIFDLSDLRLGQEADTLTSWVAAQLPDLSDAHFPFPARVIEAGDLSVRPTHTPLGALALPVLGGLSCPEGLVQGVVEPVLFAATVLPTDAAATAQDVARVTLAALCAGVGAVQVGGQLRAGRWAGSGTHLVVAEVRAGQGWWGHQHPVTHRSTEDEEHCKRK